MKKLLGIALLTCVGCFTALPPDATKLNLAPTSAAKSVPPVTADQVTARNGREIAQALADEMDRETPRE